MNPRSTARLRVWLELLPNEEQFVVVENHSNDRTRVALRSLATGEVLDSDRLHNRNRTASGLAVSPDGTLAVVLSEMSAFVYSTSKLRRTPQVVRNDNKKHFTAVAFHPSGRFLAATSNDETVKLYDTARFNRG